MPVWLQNWLLNVLIQQKCVYLFFLFLPFSFRVLVTMDNYITKLLWEDDGFQKWSISHLLWYDWHLLPQDVRCMFPLFGSGWGVGKAPANGVWWKWCYKLFSKAWSLGYSFHLFLLLSFLVLAFHNQQPYCEEARPSQQVDHMDRFM